MSNLPRFFGGRDWASFRQMADEVDSLEGFRTRTRVVGDTVMTMRTKGGMPIVTKQNLLSAAPIERLFPAFLARPVSESQRTGPYAMWSRWDTTAMPPGALTPLDTTMRSGNHTWYGEGFRAGATTLAVVSWCGTPWRYGTYSYGDRFIPFDMLGMADANGNIGSPFVKSDGEFYDGSLWEYYIGGAFSPFGKQLWLNTTKIVTQKVVLGAGLRRIGNDCYIYYCGYEKEFGATQPVYSINRLRVGAENATPEHITPTGIVIGAEELVGNIDFSSVPKATTYVRQISSGEWVANALPVEAPTTVEQMVFFNASCSECCTLVGTRGRATAISQDTFCSFSAIRVNTDSCALTVVKSSKFEINIGAVQYDMVQTGNGHFVEASHPNTQGTQSETSTCDGGYRYKQEVLMCDWVGNALDVLWWEIQTVQYGFAYSYNGSVLWNYDVQITNNGNIETSVTSLTANGSWSHSLNSSPAPAGPLGNSDAMVVKSLLRGTLWEKTLPQSTLSGGSSWSASYSDTATTIRNRDTGDYLQQESLEPLPWTPVSGTCERSENTIGFDYNKAYVCDGDIRSGVLVWGLVCRYTQQTASETLSNTRPPGEAMDGYRKGVSSFNITIDDLCERFEKAEVFLQEVDSSSHTFNRNRTLSGTDAKMGTGQVVFASRPAQQADTNWEPSYLGAQIPKHSLLTGVLADYVPTGNAYPKVCGVATAKTVAGEQYVYGNLCGIDLLDSSGVAWNGFAKKVGSAVSLHNTADNYSPSGDMRALARPVFLPKGST